VVDAHCHLDLHRNPEALALRCERAWIATVAVTNRPSHYEMALQHIGAMTYVHPALGFHPSTAGVHTRGDLRLFSCLIHNARFVGEVGLHFDSAPSDARAKQLEVFSAVLECVGVQPRMVSLHSFGAEAEVVRMVADAALAHPVLHWFCGSAAVLDDALCGGFLFSVNPAMVQSRGGRECLRRIPHDRVLTESDGPYVRIGAGPATPAHVVLVHQGLASLWGADAAAAEAQVDANFDRMIAACGLPVRPRASDRRAAIGRDQVHR